MMIFLLITLISASKAINNAKLNYNNNKFLQKMTKYLLIGNKIEKNMIFVR